MLGRGSLAMLSDLQQLDRLDDESRQTELDSRLRKAIERATDVDWYRENYAGIDLNADEPVTKLLGKLPILEKKDIRGNAIRFVKDGNTEGLGKTQTGGSTGVPLKTFNDPMNAVCGMAAMWYGRLWWGLSPGASCVNLWGHSKYLSDTLKQKMGLFKQRAKDRFSNRLVFPAYDLSEENLHSFFKIVDRRRPEFILGYSSAIYAAAEFAVRNRIKINGLKGVICTGEVLYPWQSPTVEKGFGAPVISEYGLSEVTIVAYSCPKGCMHVFEGYIHVEILDENGNEVDQGEVGRIVVTMLHNGRVPIIRYDTGDLAMRTENCSCGMGSRTLGPIQGRAYDLIRTPDGKGVVAGVLFTHTMKAVNEIQRFQIVQKEFDKILIRYESSQPITEERMNECRDLINRQAPQAYLIDFEHFTTLPSEKSGKFRWIKSELSPQVLKDSQAVN
jgi:phenylacetate-CoA ligase